MAVLAARRRPWWLPDARRVLVVEDDDAIRRLVSMALIEHGCEVVVASNGAVALERVREQRADLILLDMNMPIMDGWEFARRYKELEAARAIEQGMNGGRGAGVDGRAAVIVMTAGTSASSRAAQIEADDYLAKPFDLDQLIGMVERYLTLDHVGVTRAAALR